VTMGKLALDAAVSNVCKLSEGKKNKIGADIIMALDDVVKTTITGPRVEEATYRTLRWIDRCIKGNGA
ncbi:hypothetical protein Taro_033200, partial [Colocasia esculenta]|nr:hypothetical protein [Colocasia esculenta]